MVQTKQINIKHKEQQTTESLIHVPLLEMPKMVKNMNKILLNCYAANDNMLSISIY